MKWNQLDCTFYGTLDLDLWRRLHFLKHSLLEKSIISLTKFLSSSLLYISAHNLLIADWLTSLYQSRLSRKYIARSKSFKPQLSFSPFHRLQCRWSLIWLVRQFNVDRCSRFRNLVLINNYKTVSRDRKTQMCDFSAFFDITPFCVNVTMVNALVECKIEVGCVWVFVYVIIESFIKNC